MSSTPYDRVVVRCQIMRPYYGTTSVYPASEHEEVGGQQVHVRLQIQISCKGEDLNALDIA
jgi:hypothetical protein